MRFRRCFVLVAALPWRAWGQQAEPTVSTEALASALAEMPKCALGCLVSAVSNSTCALTNATCICTTESIEKTGTPCILAACSLTEALFAKNLTETTCQNPIRDKSAKYNAMNLSLGVIVPFLVAVRIVFKRFFSYRRQLGWDDWAIFVTLIIGVPCTIFNQVGLIAHGLGTDVWTVQPDVIPEFAMWFYVMEILYIAEMGVIKLSLSLFYLEIFPGTTVRRILAGTALVNVLFPLAFVLTAIFQCTPVNYYWTQYKSPPAAGHCIDLNRFGWVNGAMGIAIDLWMIAIPLSQIRRLRLHWKKKVGVTFMFLIGTFVTVVSILRLQSLVYFANSINPTWDEWNVAWWSTIEVNIGMLCTCLPTIRLILVRACPRVFSTDTLHSRDGERRTDSYGRNSHMAGHKQIELSSIEGNDGDVEPKFGMK